MNRPLLTIAAGLMMLTDFAPSFGAQEPAAAWTMMNPTGREYRDELVRLKIDPPDDLSPDKYTVTEDGRPVAWQIEEIDGHKHIWVCADLIRGQTHSYALRPGRSPQAKPRVVVTRKDDVWEMSSDVLAVRVPAAADALLPPVLQVRLPGGEWVGRGSWNVGRGLKSFTSERIGDGTLFGRLRLRYKFEGKGGLFGETPAFYQVDVTVQPGRRHMVIEESYAMGRDESWEFDVAAGWGARGAVVRPHFGGFGRPIMTDPDGNPYPWPPETLKVGQTRMGDTLLNLVPRWSQAYDDGWLFMATDDNVGVGAVVCRAGKWLWPYNSMSQIRVKPSADYAGLRCPTWRGKRYWYLISGPKDLWASEASGNEYVLRHAVEGLDKLHQEYILDWPGLKPPAGGQLTPEEVADWSSGAGRFARRDKAFAGWGPGGAYWRGPNHPITLLTQVQSRFDPDTYGTHWLYYSPENPNFFTSWVNMMFGGLDRLKDHPRFEAIRTMAEQKSREELYFGVTMPGGAGQECFGYMARGSWQRRANFCREHLGFDPWQWGRIQAAGLFILKTSHPMADGSRRSHPGGDTHPPGPDPFEAARSVGADADVSEFQSEEFPGFGAVLRNRPATPRETYFAFKSGPNRGHFHGDQLSFHYCANGHPLIVDHHCSYGPRAGQEHMHNRVAFHTDEMPWANMDGYERLIAFKTCPQVDVAIGQVDSERLRETTEFPPELWDTSLPQVPLDPHLAYRRTVVLLKGGPQDIIVMRDQGLGPDLYATYCLHVYGDTCERKGNRFEFDGVQLVVARPERFEVSRHDWQHENGGPEATKGLRLTTRGKRSEFITVLVPRPRKLFPVTRLTLARALPRVDTDRRTRQTTTSHHDLGLVLTWQRGRILADAYVSAPGYDRRMRFTGTVTEQNGTDALTLRLGGEGARKGRKKPLAWAFALVLTRTGNAYSGTYDGTVDGQPVKGSVSGSHDEAGASPMLVYEQLRQPPVEVIADGVKIGDVKVTFHGGIDDRVDTPYVKVTKDGEELMSLTGRDIDMDRSQGEIGIFIPDAGYPFGVIPDWLLRQRAGKPDWYRKSWPPTELHAGR